MQDLSRRFNISVPKQIEFAQPVLVIQGQQDLRLIVAHQLQKLTFSKVIQCATGIEALDIIQQTENLQAVFCDFSMQDMSAADLLAEIKNNHSFYWAPIVITMEQPSQEKLMLMVESGAEEIMAKPFTLGDIMPKLKAAFAKFHNPKNPEKVYELAKSSLRQENLTEAKEIYQALAESAPQAARPWVGLANAAHLAKDLPEAYRCLQEAEKRNAKFVHIYAYRGQWLAEEKKWDEALKNFQRAIELSPLNGFRYKAASELLMQEKKYEEAKTLLQAAISLNIQFPDLHHFLSQACFALKDFKGAIKAIRQALSADAENITYLNQLGICYKEVEMIEDAIKTYNAVIKLDPDNIPALYNKGILCKDQGQTGEAIKIFERILKKKPNFAPALQKVQELKSTKQAS